MYTAAENQALIVDLVSWVMKEPRTYDDVMEAWRTSCPRLPIWEDCVDLGYLERRRIDGGIVIVEVTDIGEQFLKQCTN